MTNIRKSRGYAYESMFVGRLQKRGWHAFRLGGTQIHLPDVLAIHHGQKHAAVFELKTGAASVLYVKAHQIRRLNEWQSVLRQYRTATVLAFRFHTAGRTRDTREYMYTVGDALDYKCDYDGNLQFRIGKTWVMAPRLAWTHSGAVQVDI